MPRTPAALLAALAAASAAALAGPGPGNAILVSVNAEGAAAAGDCFEASVSNNGRFVAFETDASNLGPADGNGRYDMYWVDRRGGEPVLASRDGEGAPGNDDSYYAALSANGRWLVYETEATNLASGGGPGLWQVMLYDARTGENREISTAPGGVPGDGACEIYDSRPLSASGRWIVFRSASANLVEDDLNSDDDIFLHDARTGTTVRLTVGVDGEAQGDSFHASLSPNGRWVLWTSESEDLVEDDGNGYRDVFLRDLRRGTTRIVSRAANGDAGNFHSGDVGHGSVSANGRLVVFPSDATNLDPEATETLGRNDLFLADLRGGTVRRITASHAGGEANGDAGSAAMDPAGRFITYWTYATNSLEADNGLEYDQVGYDVATGENVRMVHALAGGLANGATYAYGPQMSANGRWYTPSTYATDAVAEDTGGNSQILLIDLR